MQRDVQITSGVHCIDAVDFHESEIGLAQPMLELQFHQDLARPLGTDETGQRDVRLGWLVFLAIVAVVLGTAAFYAYDWWTDGGFIVSICHGRVGAAPSPQQFA
jgi:hypothetical protein